MPREMTSSTLASFLMHGTRTAKVATTMSSGQPHVMPVWFVLDGEELVFSTGARSVKGRNLRRDPSIALVVDEDVAPYAFVHIRGRARISEDWTNCCDLPPRSRVATWAQSAPRSSDNATPVPGELLVRVTPERIIAEAEVAGY